MLFFLRQSEGEKEPEYLRQLLEQTFARAIRLCMKTIGTQGAQYPLTEEYSLNHIMDPRTM